MESTAGTRLDWREGPEAIERTIRTAIMMVDGAIRELEGLGYDRSRDRIEIDQADDGSRDWMSVRCGGLVRYAVEFKVVDSNVFIVGTWVSLPRRRGWLRRLIARIFRA